MRQKPEQLELALDSRGETPRSQRSGEAPTTPHGTERSGRDQLLMEQMVARVNALAALKRVKQNKGSQKHGASALGLQRVLGLHSYQTAWAWLHKLRRAMVRLGRDRLSSEVEVDETYVGGPEQGVAGRQTDSKCIVAIAAEVCGQATRRIRMHRIPDVSGESLLPFVQEAVAPGARVRTDGWSGYAGLDRLGYRHKPQVIRGGSRPAPEVMPRVHKVASLLKRWLLGTLHGGIQPQHLDYYLDEFTFRFNRRTSKSRGQLFYRLVQQSVVTGAVPYRSLVGGKRRPNQKT